MNRNPDTYGQLVKFFSLLIAVLLLACAIACVFFGTIFLALCSAIVSAYAWMLFFDALKGEIVEEVHNARSERSEERDQSVL